MLLATKDEVGVHLDDEENDFMLDNTYRDNTLKELNAAVIMMARIQPTDDKSDAKPTYDVEFISKVKEFQNKPEQSSGYKEAYEELKNEMNVEKEQLLNEKEEIHEELLKTQDETLKLKQESRLTTKDKMIQLDYAKLNALYGSFVPQTKTLVEQTYFSSPSTSNVSSASSLAKTNLPSKKIPNESKLLKLFVDLGNEIKQLGILIDNSMQREKERIVIYDEQNKIRKYFTKEKYEMLMCEMEKISRVASSSSVRKPKSKDTNSKKRVLLNTKSKSTSKNVKNSQSSFTLVFNKNDTMNSNVFDKSKYSGVSDEAPKTLFVAFRGVATLNLDFSTTRVAPNLLDFMATGEVIQIVLSIVDSRCSKHMTGNLKLLRNFIEKFMCTIRYGNYNFVAITGYGDYV
nr:integrase, catalytic region, zinc finger, CCHC-type, peptidase aspartic, catalytic [Tanacetum cinerariifolium]